MCQFVFENCFYELSEKKKKKKIPVCRASILAQWQRCVLMTVGFSDKKNVPHDASRTAQRASQSRQDADPAVKRSRLQSN